MLCWRLGGPSTGVHVLQQVQQVQQSQQHGCVQRGMCTEGMLPGGGDRGLCACTCFAICGSALVRLLLLQAVVGGSILKCKSMRIRFIWCSQGLCNLRLYSDVPPCFFSGLRLLVGAPAPHDGTRCSRILHTHCRRRCCGRGAG